MFMGNTSPISGVLMNRPTTSYHNIIEGVFKAIQYLTSSFLRIFLIKISCQQQRNVVFLNPYHPDENTVVSTYQVLGNCWLTVIR
jgi:hypothetical protein